MHHGIKNLRISAYLLICLFVYMCVSTTVQFAFVRRCIECVKHEVHMTNSRQHEQAESCGCTAIIAASANTAAQRAAAAAAAAAYLHGTARALIETYSQRQRLENSDGGTLSRLLRQRQQEVAQSPLPSPSLQPQPSASPPPLSSSGCETTLHEKHRIVSDVSHGLHCSGHDRAR